MKALITIFFLFPILALCQDKQHAVGIDKGTFNKETDAIVEETHLDSYLEYTSDIEYTTLWMAEYDQEGKVLKHVRMPVIRMVEDKEIMTFLIRGDGYDYEILFWKDGSMVAYRFSETYVLLTGAIEY
ncbi:MAG: hypothetical protein WDZ35_07915 [Crocinitomicaceae bacterium]